MLETSPSLSFDWFSSVRQLKGVGEKIAQKLLKLQVDTLGDLLFHFPFRYEDRTRITLIKDLIPEQSCVIQGEIVACQVQLQGKKRAIVSLQDETGLLTIWFYHFHPSQRTHWQVGNTMRCYGQIKQVARGLQMMHPEYEILDDILQKLPQHLTPVYPTVAGLSQNFLRKIICQNLKRFTLDYKNKEDPFLHKFRPFISMLSLVDTLNKIHAPHPTEDIASLISNTHIAFKRLILEELYVHHLVLNRLREGTKALIATPLNVDEGLLQRFLKALPFTLTAAQLAVWNEIKTDLARNTPMLRLVQGDVGCGKTVVAALAAIAALSQGKQIAIMVPTEILAEQHYAHFEAWFAPLGFRCGVLTGKLKSKCKREVKEDLQLGLLNIVIGTHALFQEDIQFAALGLVIIDEQHRFGVHQRLALQLKGRSTVECHDAHQLIMTATPIPRTLAMSHYAHLDISVIDSLPPNRQAIKTVAISQSRRDEIIDRIHSVCLKGQQVYWVCTLIAESETLECQAAVKAAEFLQSVLSHRVGLVHGKLTPMEKEQVMQAFYCGEISVLVATTVIEVGVNVPNATLMIIENPERLGLAQLHQLRGRVGRGSELSYCVLLYQSPLSHMAQARLRILRESSDGFVIAEADLTLRGPGEILGVRQTGLNPFKIADLTRDKELITMLPTWSKQVTSFSSNEIEEMIKRWSASDQYVQA